jgi:group II intron reverse transcriptase/maturase
MIEQILHPRNLQKALSQVTANKGSAGVDGMATTELSDYLGRNRETMSATIKAGKYRAEAILGVEIPKGNGKTRMLGVPTVKDRLLQQAATQVLAQHYEQGFSENSYGFRPQKSARQAVGKALEYIHEGNTYIVDIDLKNFFDEVDHCLLLNLLYQKVKCRATLKLVRQWLRAPIRIGGKLHKRRKGVPQGSPLSPLLSNILLNELDKELKVKGLQFVRYADDFSIYCKSKSIATYTMKKVTEFLRTKLHLIINEEKSGIRKPVQFTLLGFGFVPTYQKGVKGRYQLVASEKALIRLKQSVKSITRKTSPMTFDERIQKINETQRGWLNYFRGASIQGKLRDIDGWLRNRLRCCIWKHWRAERKENSRWLFLANEPVCE